MSTKNTLKRKMFTLIAIVVLLSNMQNMVNYAKAQMTAFTTDACQTIENSLYGM